MWISIISVQKWWRRDKELCYSLKVMSAITKDTEEMKNSNLKQIVCLPAGSERKRRIMTHNCAEVNNESQWLMVSLRNPVCQTKKMVPAGVLIVIRGLKAFGRKRQLRWQQGLTQSESKGGRGSCRWAGKTKKNCCNLWKLSLNNKTRTNWLVEFMEFTVKDGSGKLHFMSKQTCLGGWAP